MISPFTLTLSVRLCLSLSLSLSLSLILSFRCLPQSACTYAFSRALPEVFVSVIGVRRARLDQVHLHVELLLGRSQHPSPHAEPALGCGRPKPQTAGNFQLESPELPEPRSKLKPGYPVYFESELLDYGLAPKRTCSPQRDLRLPSPRRLQQRAHRRVILRLRRFRTQISRNKPERPEAALPQAPTRVQTCGATRRRDIATASRALWSL